MIIKEIKEFTPEYLKAAQELTVKLDPDLSLLTEENFRVILESGNSRLFFIFVEDNIAGMLTVGIYYTPSGSKAWIEDVVINDGYRGLGLGKAIVQYAVDFVRSENISQLMLTSNPKRVAANELYKSLSFEQKETNVYRMKFEQ